MKKFLKSLNQFTPIQIDAIISVVNTAIGESIADQPTAQLTTTSKSFSVQSKLTQDEKSVEVVVKMDNESAYITHLEFTYHLTGGYISYMHMQEEHKPKPEPIKIGIFTCKLSDLLFNNKQN